MTDLFSSPLFLKISFWVGIILTVAFLYLYFAKEGRDERGRMIMARACFVAIIALIVLLNIYSVNLGFLIQSKLVLLNALQILYDIVLFLIVGVVLLFRKIT